MPSNNKSPLSSSVPSNPNPRSSEISNPMRRSFSGNPFSKPSLIANPRTNFPNTPVNSPSGMDLSLSLSYIYLYNSLGDCALNLRNCGGFLYGLCVLQNFQEEALLGLEKVEEGLIGTSWRTKKTGKIRF